MPLPVLEPESTTPATPMVLFVNVPESDGSGAPMFAAALKKVTALPLASRIELPLTAKFIVPLVDRFRLPPPMTLNAWLFDIVLFVNWTFIVVLLWPVKFARSPTADVNVFPSPALTPPTIELIWTLLPTRASTARLVPPSLKFWIAPKLQPLTVRFTVVPEAVLTIERLRPRPPLITSLVKVAVPVMPLVAEFPK